MKKSVYFLFFIILCNYNLVNAADKINLIGLNDIKIIFSTGAVSMGKYDFTTSC